MAKNQTPIEVEETEITPDSETVETTEVAPDTAEDVEETPYDAILDVISQELSNDEILDLIDDLTELVSDEEDEVAEDEVAEDEVAE